VIESLRSRYWLVANSGNRNEPGQDPAQKLVPGSNVLNFSDAEASVTQRAALATRHL
jgi:Cu2+-containing amine oxidase